MTDNEIEQMRKDICRCRACPKIGCEVCNGIMSKQYRKKPVNRNLLEYLKEYSVTVKP